MTSANENSSREFNVLISVVDIVPASTQNEAVEILSRRLREAGFDVYEGSEVSVLLSEEE
jgi:spore coat polysaccharide biosynthesis protein SpsF (cytidylyltransferase family)